MGMTKETTRTVKRASSGAVHGVGRCHPSFVHRFGSCFVIAFVHVLDFVVILAPRLRHAFRLRSWFSIFVFVFVPPPRLPHPPSILAFPSLPPGQRRRGPTS